MDGIDANAVGHPAIAANIITHDIAKIASGRVRPCRCIGASAAGRTRMKMCTPRIIGIAARADNVSGAPKSTRTRLILIQVLVTAVAVDAVVNLIM